MKNANGNDFQLNQFEYAYLVKDEDPNAETMEVFVPKLHGNMNPSAKGSSKPVDKSVFMNSGDSTIQSSGSASERGSIIARVVMPLAHRHQFHDCEGCPCPNKVHDAVTCHSGTSHLKPCNHYHHDHHFPHVGDFGMVPEGTKVIVMFMDENVNDCWVTRFCCDFPGQKGNGALLPRERNR